mmetsp:Transcript_30456/g.54705  ORF Transcript_30456/g.54705 Transcript_30456/m.54705 type:complete len:376 (-) Transcript_30456:240-1367(-)
MWSQISMTPAPWDRNRSSDPEVATIRKVSSLVRWTARSRTGAWVRACSSSSSPCPCRPQMRTQPSVPAQANIRLVFQPASLGTGMNLTLQMDMSSNLWTMVPFTVRAGGSVAPGPAGTVVICHSRMVPSSLPEIIHLPSKDTSTDRTQSSWPSILWAKDWPLGLLRSQMMIDVSAPAVMTRDPWLATLRMAAVWFCSPLTAVLRFWGAPMLSVSPAAPPQTTGHAVREPVLPPVMTTLWSGHQQAAKRPLWSVFCWWNRSPKYKSTRLPRAGPACLSFSWCREYTWFCSIFNKSWGTGCSVLKGPRWKNRSALSMLLCSTAACTSASPFFASRSICTRSRTILLSSNERRARCATSRGNSWVRSSRGVSRGYRAW